MHLILFFLFAGFCLAGAINLLLQSHPINSALSLIVVMTSLAVLYLLLGAEFLAAAQVIVYAGAIMVLFTFVVMLLNAGREERTMGSRSARIVGFPAVTVLLAVLATLILHAQGLFGAATLDQGITSTEDLEPRPLSRIDSSLRSHVGARSNRHPWARLHWPVSVTEKGRPEDELPARSAFVLVSAPERSSVHARRGRLSHQAQSHHNFYVN